MLTFDEKKLVADLERLPRPLRVAFAAACAERQMPAYRAFVSEHHIEKSDALDQALHDAWENPTKRDRMELQQQLQKCMALIPREDVVQPWTEGATYAQNAGISVAYTLRARIGGEAQDAAWSARVAYESLDHFVINRENIDTNHPGGEARVLSHSLVQGELLRQRRDLDELLSGADRDTQQMVAQLRSRAGKEAALFFAPT